MSEREICGVCQEPWPSEGRCECAPQAAPVVLMDAAERLADGMARRNDPVVQHPYEAAMRDVTWSAENGDHCGHYRFKYDLDMDKRLVACRDCHTILDPYEVLQRLASLDRRTDERLKELRNLEKEHKEWEAARSARAAARRHPYDPVSRYDPITKQHSPEACNVCRGPRGGAIHDAKVRQPRRRREVTDGRPA